MNNADIGNNLNVRGGLNIGTGGIFSNGPLAVTLASTTQTNAVSAYFQGMVGIGTTTPWGLLSIAPGTSASTSPQFVSWVSGSSSLHSLSVARITTATWASAPRPRQQTSSSMARPGKIFSRSPRARIKTFSLSIKRARQAWVLSRAPPPLWRLPAPTASPRQR